jgi:hypothetical protein
MKAARTDRLGGFLFSSVQMLEGERLLQAEVAAQRYSPSPMRGATGRLYLTNMRLIWSPYCPVSWILRKKPQIIPLTEIEGCTLAKEDFFLGYAADVHMGKATYRFRIGGILTTRDETAKWVAAVEGAARAAKRAG